MDRSAAQRNKLLLYSVVWSDHAAERSPPLNFHCQDARLGSLLCPSSGPPLQRQAMPRAPVHPSLYPFLQRAGAKNRRRTTTLLQVTTFCTLNMLGVQNTVAYPFDLTRI
jgi:hypothetical protein